MAANRISEVEKSKNRNAAIAKFNREKESIDDEQQKKKTHYYNLRCR